MAFLLNEALGCRTYCLSSFLHRMQLDEEVVPHIALDRAETHPRPECLPHSEENKDEEEVTMVSSISAWECVCIHS